MSLRLLILLLCSVTVLATAEQGPAALFEEPVPLADASGVTLITGKAQGCPYAADYNGDGVIDIILGAKDGMSTAQGGIWLIPNKGTNAAPDYSWSNAFKLKLDSADLSVACGCKSSGQVQPLALDWNGDGWMDIVFSDTYRRTYLLINQATNREQPTFKKQTFFEMEKENHGMYAGGGDWNNDGILDFMHMPFSGGSYKLCSGVREGAALTFKQTSVKQCEVLKVSGERNKNKAHKCAWAWNYSGSAKTRNVTEYVGVLRSPRDPRKEVIGFFEIKGGQSKLIEVIHEPQASSPLLTSCDVNGDGKMDIIFSGGLWKNQKDMTQIYVMFGKVRNIQ